MRKTASTGSDWDPELWATVISKPFVVAQSTGWPTGHRSGRVTSRSCALGVRCRPRCTGWSARCGRSGSATGR